jgi:hypothetical protein
MATTAEAIAFAQPGQFVFRRIHALQWTGSNGAEVAEFYTALDADKGVYSVVSESADRLVLQSVVDGRVFGQREIRPDRPWIIMDQTSGVIGTITTASYEIRFVRGVDMPDIIGVPDAPYFGYGIGLAASTIGIGATVNVDVQVFPAIPPTKIAGIIPVTKILASTGINLGTVAVAATPTVLTALVPMALVNGVIIPAHTVIRSRVKNSGLSILSNVQVVTTASA